MSVAWESGAALPPCGCTCVGAGDERDARFYAVLCGVFGVKQLRIQRAVLLSSG